MPFMWKKKNGREPKKVPLAHFILETVIHQLVKIGAMTYVLAWLLAFTSTQAVVNLPLALAVVLVIRFLSQRIVVDTRSGAMSSRSSRRMDRYMFPPVYYREKFGGPGGEGGGGHNDREAWKKIMSAPIVASAWESLCGSILQEWVYDAWYSSVTPDRDFPASIRRLLNEIFADVAQRAKRIDLRNVLIRDMCDLFMEHLELYRATKEAVGILKKGDLRPSSIDRAFQQEMRTEGTLHVAFCSRDGHYKVIRRICEGVLSVVMSKDDLMRPYTKGLAREMMATCLIRPILMYFSPHTANKLILSAFPEELNPDEKKMHEHDRQNVNRERQNGHFLFEQRVRKSAALEERAVKRAMDRGNNQKTFQANNTHLVSPSPNRKDQTHRQHHSPQKLQDMDGCSIDDSAMGNEVVAPVISLRRRRSKSVDAVNAMVMESGVAGKTDDIYRAPSLPGAVLTTTASEPTSRMQTSHSVPRVSSLPKWMPPQSDASPEGSPLAREQNLQFNSQVQAESMEFPGDYKDIIGFKGHPRAMVVVHEVMYDTSGKRYVVFKIRVADDSGEWTVARRYRNFETLHKILRDDPVYQSLKLKLPRKGFLHSQNTEFVEERRVSLDRYLQRLLSDKALANNVDVAAFLSDQNHQLYKHNLEISLLRTITDNVDCAKHKVKRAVGYASKLETGSGSGCDEDICSGQTKSSAHKPMDSSELDPLRHAKSLGALSTPTGRKSSSFHAFKPIDPGVSQRPYSPRVPQHFSSIGGYNMSPGQASRCQSPWQDGSSVFSSRPDSPGRSVRGSDVKSVSMCDTRSVGGSSDTPIKGASNREDVGREAFAWNSLPVMESEDTWPDWDTEFEDYSGISGPLYEVVDAVLALPAQKFFRRQVLQVVRQLLSLLAGDSIDLFLLEKIKSLRTEHTLARLIHMIQNGLWPGGKWYATVPPYCDARAEFQAANPGARKSMQPDRYLEPLWGPKDAVDVAEKVHHRLIHQAPPALVRIVGKGCYTNGMQDVYDMLQLPTFMTQMGYGVLEIVLLALFPELRDFFARIHREAAHLKDS